MTDAKRAWADAILTQNTLARSKRPRHVTLHERHHSGRRWTIALDRNNREVIALLGRAAERGMRVTIPATALAHAIRNPAKQARLRRLIGQPDTDLMHLNGAHPTAVGLLLARTGAPDIVDAHVVVCAERAGQAVLTAIRMTSGGYPRICI